MKNLSLTITLLALSYFTFAQEAPKTTISVIGLSQKTFYPNAYKVTFLLQEEIRSESAKTMDKTWLDTIRHTFFENVKAYGLKESDFLTIRKSSTPSNGYGGRNASPLYNIVYQLRNIKSDLAQKLVDDLRTPGLKGIVAKPQYGTILKPVVDSLYSAALADAHINAFSMAKQLNKTVGQPLNVGTGYNTLHDFNTEFDANDYYSLSKFEITLIDSKPFPVTVTITYELK
ncbi:SIMPL domain-containing protein [Mucilaginibacter gracilis]|nr:SIMPL domain-containing protein [Mucilaginibacter gracilis]